MPCCAFGRSFGASQPGAGEGIEALADRGQKAKVVSLGLNLPQEGAALRGSEHVKEGILGEAQPADRAAPVVVHGAESGPCPAELVERLDEAPDWPSTEEGLDVVLELFGEVAQESVSIYLPPEPQEGFTLGDSVNFQGVARNADSHEGPELHPLVSFGPNGGFEGVVVSCLNWS